MNTAHLHLLLNHFPVIGSVMALALLLAAVARKHEDLMLASLAGFFLMALITIPVFLSGAVAQLILAANNPDIDPALMTRHLDGGLLAFVAIMITATFSWVGLWIFRRTGLVPGWTLYTVLVLGAVTVALMADAANMGEEIRHQEIGSGAETTALELVPGFGAATAQLVIASPWAWPVCETLHFIGLTLLASVVLVVNLRVLGLMKGVSFPALHGLLPWAMVGLGINTITGMLFFIAAPEQYTQNPAFYWKIFFLLLAGANLLYLTVFDETWVVGAGDDASVRAKLTAASALFVWFGVIFWGRLMPFLGLSF